MTTACLAPMPLLDALIAGLGVMSQGLDAKCQAALRAVGGPAVPHLLAAADAASPQRRKRIEALLATIGEGHGSSPAAGILCRDALLIAAAAQTDQDNPSLVIALKMLAPAIVDKLILEAVAKRSKPSVCLLILKMIEQLGGVGGGDAQFTIATLCASTNSAVREAALKLFSRPQPSS